MNLKTNNQFKELIPSLTDEEYTNLKESVKKEGCRDPLVIWNRTLIDGHHRYKICKKYNIKFKTIEKEFDSNEDAKIWMIKNQLARRNLTPFQRSKLALEEEKIIAKKGKEQQGIRTDISQKSVKSVDTQKELAKKAKVSHDTIYKVKEILEKRPEAEKDINSGKVSINKVFNDIKHTEKLEDNKHLIEERINLPKDKFNIILADPPWKYNFSGTKIRSIEAHYPSMELNDICDLKVPSSDDSILFLWTTSPKLEESFRVIDAWGFEYKTSFVWVKDKIGMGYYCRGQHEFLLVSTKGNIKVPLPKNRFSSVINSPRSKHSKKPELVYGIIENMYPEGKYLELFARNNRKNWYGWGLEYK